MKLPTPKQLGAALRKWREDRGKTGPEISQESEHLSKKAFAPLQVVRWEGGKQSFSYKRLVEDILPAYEIHDFDTFLDSCRCPSLDDVTVIPANSFTRSEIREGVRDFYVTKAFLEKSQHRTRIDRVVFSAGKQNTTDWGNHNGHEFVLVLKGVVTCEFAVNKRDCRQPHTLTTGMAVVFPSSIFHRFANASDTEEAVLVVAKPTNGRTADKD